MAREGWGKAAEDAKLPQADRDFEKAVDARDFEAIIDALKAGADPNRAFADAWREHDGRRASWWLCSELDYRDARQGSKEDFAKGHAAAMKAMVEAGANFALPAIAERDGAGKPFTRPSRSSYAGRGASLWSSEVVSIDSCVWFVKGGGSLREVLDGPGELSATHSRNMRRGAPEEVLGPIWEAAIKPSMKAGGALRLLGETLGMGWLEWSRWLIDQGAKPLARVDGTGALRLLACETMFFANPSRSGHCPWNIEKAEHAKEKVRMASEAAQCAKLAVELGEDVNGRGPVGLSPLQELLIQQGKANPKLSLGFARELVKLGAKALDTPKGRPFLACALGDAINAPAQLEFALEMGVDPKDRAREAVALMIERCSPDADEEAAKAIARLAQLGADLSQTAREPVDSSLLAMAARRGLWASMRALASAGCDLSWRDAKKGSTLAAYAAHWAAEYGVVGSGEPTLRWLASQGAPMDEPDEQGWTALHRAAKALDEKACKTLLEAGADPNKATADKAASTSAHLACARFEKRKEKRQLGVLEALGSFGADFSKLDGKKRSAMEVASKKGFLSVVQSVADKAKGVALDGESGARASKKLQERGAGFLSVVEESELSAAAPAPAAKRSKRSL